MSDNKIYYSYTTNIIHIDELLKDIQERDEMGGNRIISVTNHKNMQGDIDLVTVIFYRTHEYPYIINELDKKWGNLK